MKLVIDLLDACSIVLRLAQDTIRFVLLGSRSSVALRAENLFLRKQIALYVEREVKPRRADRATRASLVLLSSLFDWRGALTIVKPETLMGWHRKGFQLFSRWKSKPRGRPRIPPDLRSLIQEMGRGNPSWGEERIAAELLLKLGIRVSPRTVRRYLPVQRVTASDPSHRWMTFVGNHAKAIIACDFFVAATARFRLLYVFVVMEIGTRRIIHLNVTTHPTADWTLQQFREVMIGDEPYRFVLHDRDSIYSPALDLALTSMGVRVLKTPFRAPQANAFCERVIGTIRRECLDFLIPLGERHLLAILKEWVAHYNRGWPHASLGPGIPDPGLGYRPVKLRGHRLPPGHQVTAKSILGGLHHEYRLQRKAA